MISSQLGTEFTTNTDDPLKYGNIKKVYSIWICTETAQKRANSIESYALDRKILVGANDDNPRYDIMNTTIIIISEKHDVRNTENSTIKLLTDLFDNMLDGESKIAKLTKEHGLPLTREVESEVSKMCTYADSIEKKGLSQGISQGMEKGLKALVKSLKPYLPDFDALYEAVIKNEDYSKVSREQVKKYY